MSLSDLIFIIMASMRQDSCTRFFFTSSVVDDCNCPNIGIKIYLHEELNSFYIAFVKRIYACMSAEMKI